MKKILIITASPNKNSLTYQNANIIEKQAVYRGLEVSRIEAFNTPLMGEKLNDADLALVEKAKNLILNADYIAIFAPLWNFGIPGALKNFFDITITPKVHFKFTNLGFAKGLIKAKKVYIFYTSGTPAIFVKLFPFISSLVWSLKLIFFMCGVRRFKVYHLGGLIEGKVKKENIEKWFKKLENVKFE